MQYSVIIPWKLDKNTNYHTLNNFYLDRISNYTNINAIYSSKNFKTPVEYEAFFKKELLKFQQQNFCIIALDEQGKHSSSTDFASQIAKLGITYPNGIVFCIGGAYGLPDFSTFPSFNSSNLYLVSLSKLTFSHELALLVIYEQLYRAQTIITNHPYHHANVSPLAMKIKGKNV